MQVKRQRVRRFTIRRMRLRKLFNEQNRRQIDEEVAVALEAILCPSDGERDFGIQSKSACAARGQ